MSQAWLGNPSDPTYCSGSVFPIPPWPWGDGDGTDQREKLVAPLGKARCSCQAAQQSSEAWGHLPVFLQRPS